MINREGEHLKHDLPRSPRPEQTLDSLSRSQCGGTQFCALPHTSPGRWKRSRAEEASRPSCDTIVYYGAIYPSAAGSNEPPTTGGAQPATITQDIPRRCSHPLIPAAAFVSDTLRDYPRLLQTMLTPFQHSSPPRPQGTCSRVLNLSSYIC